VCRVSGTHTVTGQQGPAAPPPPRLTSAGAGPAQVRPGDRRARAVAGSRPGRSWCLLLPRVVRKAAGQGAVVVTRTHTGGVSAFCGSGREIGHGVEVADGVSYGSRQVGCAAGVVERAGAVGKEQVRDGHTACRHRGCGAQFRDHLADVVFGRQDTGPSDRHLGVDRLAWAGRSAEDVLPAGGQRVPRGWRGEGSGADGPESVVLGVLTVGELRVQREVSPPREQPIPDPYVDKLPSAPAGGL
jgi:hypothetical protein